MSKDWKVVGKSVLAAAALTALGAVGGQAMAQEENWPKLVKPVAPEYPRAAQRRNVEGKITLKLVINADGKVDSVEVVEAEKPGIFDKAAIAAAEKWVFEAGKPTNDFVKTITFKLTG